MSAMALLGIGPVGWIGIGTAVLGILAVGFGVSLGKAAGRADERLGYK